MEHRDTHITPLLRQPVIESTLFPALTCNVPVPVAAAQMHSIPIKVCKLNEWQLLNSLQR